MKKNKIIKVSIADTTFKVEVEETLKNIYKLISCFKKSNKPTGLKVSISESLTRSIEISDDCKQLKIAGYDIDDLTNPFNLIGIIQAIFRFIGIHSIKKDIYLLHGSASIINNNAVCFGDDGKSTAKTLSSIECALNSKQYIGDEFCFLDMNTKKIFGYSFVPLHLRPKVKKHFIHTHKMIFPNSEYQETEAGYFIEPSKLFDVLASKKLNSFVFIYLNSQRTKLELLNNQQKKEAISVCLSAHLLKLFYPHLDRMQFVTKKDSIKSIPSERNLTKKLITRLSLQNAISQIAKDFPCYRAYIKKPCDIIDTMKSIK